MFEHITGGYVLAGFHEVMYTEGTKAAMEVASQDPNRILWRVSSTLFSHIRYNVDLSPMEEMKGLIDIDEANRKYRKMSAHEKLMEELRAINLAPAEQKLEEVNAQLSSMM